MTERTQVDVLSLEDFHRTLAARIGEAEAVLRKLDNELACRPPALGRFADAAEQANRYTKLQMEHGDRVRRLHTALTAAQKAAETIIANYTTTEARNSANANAIAGVLGSVDAVLAEDGK
jgi:hypothetical protein